MSNYWYIKIPFKGTREQAKEVVENIHGGMVWSDGMAWPYDSICPALITPINSASNPTLESEKYREIIMLLKQTVPDKECHERILEIVRAHENQSYPPEGQD